MKKLNSPKLKTIYTVAFAICLLATQPAQAQISFEGTFVPMNTFEII